MYELHNGNVCDGIERFRAIHRESVWIQKVDFRLVANVQFQTGVDSALESVTNPSPLSTQIAVGCSGDRDRPRQATGNWENLESLM